MMMQALVIAHACYGHNSFFKGNYLFRQWTQADAIVDYLTFACRFVMDCEELHGLVAVEETLDSCHALMNYGVHRYRRPPPLSLKEEQSRVAERRENARLQYNDLWRTVPAGRNQAADARKASFPAEPEENILYFVEKYSPCLEPWQRELVRIVRKLAQYFYPQGQTKVMNEGWATFWHYTLINRLYDKGLATDGFMMEFLQSHTKVVAQRGFDERGYGGLDDTPINVAHALQTEEAQRGEHFAVDDAYRLFDAGFTRRAQRVGVGAPRQAGFGTRASALITSCPRITFGRRRLAMRRKSSILTACGMVSPG